jgi:hypothetical protein
MNSICKVRLINQAGSPRQLAKSNVPLTLRQRVGKMTLGLGSGRAFPVRTLRQRLRSKLQPSATFVSESRMEASDDTRYAR